MNKTDDKKIARATIASLTDSEIKTTGKMGRRSALAAVGAAALGAVAAVSGSRPAAAQMTDADSGSWTDQAGRGRGSGGSYTGLSDYDDGNWTDQAGYGRGAPR